MITSASMTTQHRLQAPGSESGPVPGSGTRLGSGPAGIRTLNLGLDLRKVLGFDLNLDRGLDVGLDLNFDLHIEQRPGPVPPGPSSEIGGWDVLLWAGQSSSQGGQGLCADPLAAVPAASLTETP